MAENNPSELVLAQGQYCFIQDETKGHVQVFVGPYKTGTTNNDRPVVYDPKLSKFTRTTLTEAITQNPSAPEGHYIVLENPTAEGQKANPKEGPNTPVELNVGRKVNIPGPIMFALFPGQVAKVVPGHHLRSNQYLVVRVYNPDEAQKNIDKGVVDGKTTITAGSLTMGKLFIIKGTEVSFYIPPTGVEVLPDANGQYVREAVTLETLEYTILLDENGEKRYEHGPKVVFPEATENFVEKALGEGPHRAKKFKAVELNDQMGLYIKVLADYEEDGVKHKQGDELFLTGKEMRIYYPRPEHALIEYPDPNSGMNRQRYYGITIPKGEARYVLDKRVGDIKKVNGPCIFLPDPRFEVIVRRILDLNTVDLWYPGNAQAKEFNKKLQALGGNQGYLSENAIAGAADVSRSINRGTIGSKALTSNSVIEADTLKRGSKFTPPPMLTLDTKYEGVPSVGVWTGYAIQIVSKTGDRRVVVGPTSVLLDYDETLEVTELSTGKPKTTDSLIRTAYLRVENNRVSDIVTVETKDLVNVSLKLSYRVNFEGDNAKWFRVENYVKFLCDHLRSVLRSIAKQYTVAEFNEKATAIIRDTILGKHEEGKGRAGKLFTENGMRVYDVEVLKVSIEDANIAQMLMTAQRTTVENTIKLQTEEQKLELTRRTKEIETAIATVSTNTALAKLKLIAQETAAKFEQEMENLDSELKVISTKNEAKVKEQESLDLVAAAELARLTARDNQAMELTKGAAEIFKAKMGAITPELTSAMQLLGQTHFATQMAEALAPLAIMEQQGVETIVERLFGNSPIAKLLKSKQ